MVALLIRLKLTLLKNSLKRSTWRTVGLIIAMAYALAIVIMVLAALVGLRYTSLALTAEVTVIGYAALTLGWLLMSMLVFGVDETIDPAKFALCYDGTALWLHISSGISGAEDREGRVMSTATVFLPLIVILLGVAMITTGAWQLLVPSAGLTLTLMVTGLGVGCLVGTLWQWPAPPPGANPFTRGNAGGLPSLLSFTLTVLGTVILGLPTIALVVWSFFTPWVAYLTLPVGLVCGFVVLRIGITYGGRILDRRWPEAMRAVSEKTA